MFGASCTPHRLEHCFARRPFHSIRTNLHCAHGFDALNRENRQPGLDRCGAVHATCGCQLRMSAPDEIHAHIKRICGRICRRICKCIRKCIRERVRKPVPQRRDDGQCGGRASGDGTGLCADGPERAQPLRRALPPRASKRGHRGRASGQPGHANLAVSAAFRTCAVGWFRPVRQCGGCGRCGRCG